MLLVDDSMSVYFSIALWLREMSPFYTRAGYLCTR